MPLAICGMWVGVDRILFKITKVYDLKGYQAFLCIGHVLIIIRPVLGMWLISVKRWNGCMIVNFMQNLVSINSGSKRFDS